MTMGMAMTFLDKISSIKLTIDMVHFINIKNFCPVKGNIKRIEVKPQVGRKYFCKRHI